MKQLIVLFTVILAGCQQPAATSQKTEAPAPAQTPALPQAPLPSPGADIDFAHWPTATDKPYRVDLTVAADCAAAPTQAREAERKRHGPHYRPAIIVRTNPEAIAAFKEGAPLPVGTTIIKEKHTGLIAKGSPNEYGAMIKREPGYDSAHGDWEYLYVVLSPEKTVTRGRLESCIDCHSHAKDKDYLFRTYLEGKAAAVSGW